MVMLDAAFCGHVTVYTIYSEKGMEGSRNTNELK